MVRALLYERVLSQIYNYSTFCYDTYINSTSKINVLKYFYTVIWNDRQSVGRAF